MPDVQEAPENQTDPKHVHQNVDITIEEHRKYPDGSCMTKYYEGEKCTSCGNLIKDSLSRTVTLEKCIH